MSLPLLGGVEVVLFDWNGTLADDLERACRSMGSVLAGRGLDPIDSETFRRSFSLPLRDWLTDLGIVDHDLEAAEDEWNEQMRSCAARLHEGVRGLLAGLVESEKKVGVVSAAALRALQADLEDTGIAHFVSLVAGDCADKVPVLMEAVAGRSGVYVGDVEYDIEAGRQAGLVTVAFTGGYRPKSALLAARPDFIVDDHSQLADLFGVSSLM